MRTSMLVFKPLHALLFITLWSIVLAAPLPAPPQGGSSSGGKNKKSLFGAYRKVKDPAKYEKDIPGVTPGTWDGRVVIVGNKGSGMVEAAPITNEQPSSQTLHRMVPVTTIHPGSTVTGEIRTQRPLRVYAKQLLHIGGNPAPMSTEQLEAFQKERKKAQNFKYRGELPVEAKQDSDHEQEHKHHEEQGERRKSL